jgi:hypothetical protein
MTDKTTEELAAEITELAEQNADRLGRLDFDNLPMPITLIMTQVQIDVIVAAICGGDAHNRAEFDLAVEKRMARVLDALTQPATPTLVVPELDVPAQVIDLAAHTKKH